MVQHIKSENTSGGGSPIYQKLNRCENIWELLLKRKNYKTHCRRRYVQHPTPNIKWPLLHRQEMKEHGPILHPKKRLRLKLIFSACFYQGMTIRISKQYAGEYLSDSNGIKPWENELEPDFFKILCVEKWCLNNLENLAFISCKVPYLPASQV